MTGSGLSAWPPALLDCLPAGVELPPLNAANAKATWSVTAPVLARTATNIVLDSAGHGSLGYRTTPPTPESGCPSKAAPAPGPGVGSATITVTRPGAQQLAQLATNMVTNGFGVAGSLVSPVLQSLLGPMLISAINSLEDLTKLKGTGYLSVTYPAPGAGDHCTTTTGPTTTTTAATKGLSCPAAASAQALLGLSYPLSDFYYLVKGPTYVTCIYVADKPTVECPDGDGSFINGASGGCELVEVSELTGASGSLNTSSFCDAHGPCESEGPLPADALDGGAGYEATGPDTDKAAVYVVARKDGFEVDLGVGWEASIAKSEALIRAIFTQHFGTA
jgi:hypothetical protein